MQQSSAQVQSISTKAKEYSSFTAKAVTLVQLVSNITRGNEYILDTVYAQRHELDISTTTLLELAIFKKHNKCIQ